MLSWILGLALGPAVPRGELNHNNHNLESRDKPGVRKRRLAAQASDGPPPVHPLLSPAHLKPRGKDDDDQADP